MQFEFDPTKAAANLKKHGVSFADVESLFEDPLAVHRPDPDAGGEERFVAIGLGGAGEAGCGLHAAGIGSSSDFCAACNPARGESL